MTNLPKYAERFFAVQVSDNDGVCHKAEEDVNGWDYVVELPNAPHSGSADSQPPHDRAFVQVKSTSAAKTSVAITLSNLRKSAQDRSPWFVVLIKKVNGKPALYIRHFWKSLMEKSLKAIRTAESEGKALNKATMAISFSDEDLISGDLVRWMQDQIRLVGDYQVEKRRLYDELGYENGGARRGSWSLNTRKRRFSASFLVWEKVFRSLSSSTSPSASRSPITRARFHRPKVLYTLPPNRRAHVR